MIKSVVQFYFQISHEHVRGFSGIRVKVIQKAVGVLASSSSSGCVVALDIRNAYNSIYRKACLNSLGFARPELYVFLASFYRRCSSYWFRGADGVCYSISANEWVEQGDVLAPVLLS